MVGECGAGDRAGPDSREAPDQGARVSTGREHAERGRDGRERGAFAQQQTLHRAGLEPQREKNARLLSALLRAEREEQCRKEEARDDQEEAEAQEELAEIQRLLACRKRLLPHRHEEESEGSRVDGLPNVGFDILAARGIALKPDRREIAEAALPQGAPRLQGDKGLGRAAVAVPIRLVLVADLLQIYRHARLPVAAILLIREAGDIRHQLRVQRGSAHREDGPHAERGLALYQVPHGSRHPEPEGDAVAGRGAEILGQPLVDQHLVRPEVVRHGPALHGRDSGVGGCAIPKAQLIHEVGEHTLRARIGAQRCLADGRLQEDAVRAQFEGGAARRRQGAKLQAGILEPPELPERLRRLVGTGSLCACPYKQRVGPDPQAEFGLQELHGHEGIERRSLVGIQAEPARGPIGHDGSHAQADGHGGILNGREGRIAREQAGLIHTQQYLLALAKAQSLRQPRVDGCLITG